MDTLTSLGELLDKFGPWGFIVLVLTAVLFTVIFSLRKELTTMAKKQDITNGNIEQLEDTISELRVILAQQSSLTRSLTGVLIRYPKLGELFTKILEEEEKGESLFASSDDPKNQ
jgi:hypothetical protein